MPGFSSPTGPNRTSLISAAFNSPLKVSRIHAAATPASLCLNIINLIIVGRVMILNDESAANS
jgi:hypothetical protein